MKIFILISGLILTSCQTVIIPEQEIQNTLNQQLSTNLVTTKNKLPQKLSLYVAKKMAIKGNPSIAAAGQRIHRAKAIIEQAQAAFSPTLNARGGIAHQHLSPGTSFRTGQTDTYNAGLSASWLIYDGLIRRHQLLAASYSKISSQEDFNDVKRLLLGSVATAYFETMLAYQQMAINLELKKINERFLRDSKVKFNGGTVAKTEVDNFLVNVNDSQISYLDSKNAFETAKMALVELIGLPGIKTDDFTPVFDKMDITIPKLTTAINIALNKRPDLKALQANILSVQAQGKQAEGEYLPTVSLGAEYGVQALNHFRFGDNTRNASVAVNINWSLYSGGSTAAIIRQKKAERKELLASLSSRWNDIISQIRQQCQSLQNTLARLEVQKQTVNLNKSIYGDTQEIYHNGATTITRVNEVLTNYTVSRLNQALFEIEARRRQEILKSLMGINE
jgi:outer membrane protein